MVYWKNNSAKHLKKQHVRKGVTGENLIKLLEARLDNTFTVWVLLHHVLLHASW